jgi:hypothetical protein
MKNSTYRRDPHIHQSRWDLNVSLKSRSIDWETMFLGLSCGTLLFSGTGIMGQINEAKQGQ